MDRKYLVIAEVERTGFVAGCFKKYWSAVELANQLLLYRELFQWSESEKIIAQLRNQRFKEYSIKGNQIYFDKGIYGSTDGKYSVSIILTHVREFRISTFIRERENHSIVFNFEQHWDKRFSKYFEIFPSSIHKAN